MNKYDAYKPSGIEWIGEIPSHWEVRRFGHLFSFSRGLGITKQDLKDEGIPCVNYGEIHSKYGVFVNPEIHPLRYVEESYLEIADKSLLNRGDFVFADTSEDLEGSGNFTVLDSDLPTFAGYHTVIARHENRCNYKYLAYCFDSLEFRNQIRSAVSGIKVFSITQAILKSTKVQLPTYTEQIKIAEYLDRKTAEIDRLIADKERLLELYEEEKATLINQAVTKGLDPNAKMKDSGIEWLGKIPEYWEVKKLKYVSFLRSGNNIVSEQIKDSGDFPVFGGNGLRGYFSEFTHDGNYVLIGRQGAYCGNVKYAKGRFWASEHAVVVAPLIKYEMVYLGELLKTMNLNQYSVSAAQPGLAVETIKNLQIPFPPLEEQQSIVRHIETECARVDAKVARTEKLISLLEEYRTALISEVVTGKVKVID
ncbi:restriction endonuclease subunit S [Sinomicrobium weinanense]|uniref:Restriction endonuclease subunit S n=1 Tax=Sinomicrobium weinanense TaxID=2842200 RepID=A0A926JVQ5_9FLAO|nr:restriction endonuclease subunit S [Sinomicrobium weinanense]MBC9798244.1 restriction endonuclease subunit S [Sinomicrobium weinanense]MBU3123252.1 restriction endonuclease subunit S [Sinomicrobium weinanense]